MMEGKSKVRISLILVPVVILGLLFFGLYYVSSLRKLTVNYVNANSVSIYKTSELDKGTAPPPVSKITASGQTIRLRKGFYTIGYSGGQDYDSRFININLNDTKSIKIDPDYSESKLRRLLEQELPAIRDSLSNKYPRISLYQIEEGKLYGKGDWFGAKLAYKGQDVFNSDSLLLIMHKAENGWQVKTDPPDIYINRSVHFDIPDDVLEDVSNLR